MGHPFLAWLESFVTLLQLRSIAVVFLLLIFSTQLSIITQRTVLLSERQLLVSPIVFLHQRLCVRRGFEAK